MERLERRALYLLPCIVPASPPYLFSPLPSSAPHDCLASFALGMSLILDRYSMHGEQRHAAEAERDVEDGEEMAAVLHRWADEAWQGRLAHAPRAGWRSCGYGVGGCSCHHPTKHDLDDFPRTFREPLLDSFLRAIGEPNKTIDAISKHKRAELPKYLCAASSVVLPELAGLLDEHVMESSQLFAGEDASKHCRCLLCMHGGGFAKEMEAKREAEQARQAQAQSRVADRERKRVEMERQKAEAAEKRDARRKEKEVQEAEKAAERAERKRNEDERRRASVAAEGARGREPRSGTSRGRMGKAAGQQIEWEAGGMDGLMTMDQLASGASSSARPGAQRKSVASNQLSLMNATMALAQEYGQRSGATSRQEVASHMQQAAIDSARGSRIQALEELYPDQACTCVAPFGCHANWTPEVLQQTLAANLTPSAQASPVMQALVGSTCRRFQSMVTLSKLRLQEQASAPNAKPPATRSPLTGMDVGMGRTDAVRAAACASSSAPAPVAPRAQTTQTPSSAFATSLAMGCGLQRPVARNQTFPEFNPLARDPPASAPRPTPPGGLGRAAASLPGGLQALAAQGLQESRDAAAKASAALFTPAGERKRARRAACAGSTGTASTLGVPTDEGTLGAHATPAGSVSTSTHAVPTGMIEICSACHAPVDPKEKRLSLCISCRGQWHDTCLEGMGCATEPPRGVGPPWRCPFCLPPPPPTFSEAAPSRSTSTIPPSRPQSATPARAPETIALDTSSDSSSPGINCKRPAPAMPFAEEDSDEDDELPYGFFLWPRERKVAWLAEHGKGPAAPVIAELDEETPPDEAANEGTDEAANEGTDEPSGLQVRSYQATDCLPALPRILCPSAALF